MAQGDEEEMIEFDPITERDEELIDSPKGEPQKDDANAEEEPADNL